MMPKQLSYVPDDEKAIAPYNFVQLPVKVVKVPQPEDQTEYRGNTGYLDCTLTTESPLYIRCGHTVEEFKEGLESRQLDAFFYDPSKPQQPVLPGSSLRGVLRTLVEIVSFSRITQVSDDQKFFFRAVASTKGSDSLGTLYKDQLKPKTVRAGYLIQKGKQWLIQPAQPIDGNPFVWIREDAVTSSIPDSNFIPMKRLKDYYPQQVFNISFGEIAVSKVRPIAKKISRDSQEYLYQGVLVSSGNMMESGQNPKDLKRKYHCLVGQRNGQVNPLPINSDAVSSYRSALTRFQKEKLDENNGALIDGQCVFYCEPPAGQNEVTLFGHSPNFRIPYRVPGKTQASTARDFIPKKLCDPEILDIATVLFGFVQREKVPAALLSSLKGRISVTNAACETKENVWYEKQPIPLQILEAPKPTTFQHYLVQTTSKPSELKHYSSQPGRETVIRGHKLYWHKGKQPSIKHPNPDSLTETSYETRITPIRAGVQFKFKIHFENLNDVELGALLWVLNLAKDDRYRLSLGMGKPLGMGAVKIDHKLYWGDRQQRYQRLFEDTAWNLAETLTEDTSHYTQAFEQFILKEIDPDHKLQKLEDTRRIRMLLAMLTWEQDPDAAFLDQVRYMEIERTEESFIGKKVKPSDRTVNEYRLRPVLPTPLQVRGWEDKSDQVTENRNSENQKSGNAADPLKRGNRLSQNTEHSNSKKSRPIKKQKP